MSLVTGNPLADFKNLATATTKSTSRAGANVDPQELAGLKHLFDGMTSGQKREAKRFLRSQDPQLAATVNGLEAQKSSLFRLGQ